ncbi:MAG TPA: hypothetical protein VFM58_17735, partial [Solirubrobacteraceae bacterium]|nr:hypothetical protein [Solirubrobacteraceae bacterium]
AAATFTILAVWGFVDGRDVAGVFVADTADNVTHAILAALALVVGMPPRQRPTDGEHAARRDRGSGPRRSPASLRAVDRQ